MIPTMVLQLAAVTAAVSAQQHPVQLIGVTSNLPNNIGYQKPNAMESISIYGNGSSSIVKVEVLIHNFPSWHTNSATYAKERKVLYVMTRESTSKESLTIVGYNATTGAVVSKVPMVDSALGSFYSLWFDDIDDNVKCVLMENNTGVFSVDVDKGTATHLVDLNPQSASLELTGSAFDGATGTFYQLMLVGLFQVLYRVDTWSKTPTATAVRTSMTADNYFNSPVWSHSFKTMFGFLGNNALASLDPLTGKHKQLGKPIVSGEVDFSLNHVAYDDCTGMIYSTVVPDDGSGGASQSYEVGKHFVGVRYDGELIFKVRTPDPLMYLRVIPAAKCVAAT